MLLDLISMLFGGTWLLGEIGRPERIRQEEEAYFKKHNYNPDLQREVKYTLVSKPGSYNYELGYFVDSTNGREVVKAMKILMENRGYNYMSGEHINDPEYRRIFRKW